MTAIMSGKWRSSERLLDTRPWRADATLRRLTVKGAERRGRLIGRTKIRAPGPPSLLELRRAQALTRQSVGEIDDITGCANYHSRGQRHGSCHSAWCSY